MSNNLLLILVWRYVASHANQFGFINSNVDEAYGREHIMWEGNFKNLRQAYDIREFAVGILLCTLMLFDV
ncbi:uncharacterized protein DMAD_10202 [Drosophila madeirensis]|uniref:Uncharacterized protein n=1 Tax=Drosophila madeirensis TaxID=30013 RepID=A0AAU9F8Q8_DROMD